MFASRPLLAVAKRHATALETITARLVAAPESSAGNVVCPPFAAPALPAGFPAEKATWLADLGERGLCGPYAPADGPDAAALRAMPFIHPSFWPAAGGHRRCSMTPLQCHGDAAISLATSASPLAVGHARRGVDAERLRRAEHIHRVVCERLQWGDLLLYNERLFRRRAGDAAPPREVTVPCFVAAVGAIYVGRGLQAAVDFIVDECGAEL